MSTGEWVQIAVAGVLTLTLLAVLWYAWEARKQAKASAQMAQETLRPVMLLWTHALQLDDGPAGHIYRVWYQNVGSGPAVNISFRLSPRDGDWDRPPERVGMGVREERSWIDVGVAPPIPDQLLVVAEYEDASHSRWKTTLRLEKEDGVLTNRESKLEQIGG